MSENNTDCPANLPIKSAKSNDYISSFIHAQPRTGKQPPLQPSSRRRWEPEHEKTSRVTAAASTAPSLRTTRVGLSQTSRNESPRKAPEPEHKAIPPRALPARRALRGRQRGAPRCGWRGAALRSPHGHPAGSSLLPRSSAAQTPIFKTQTMRETRGGGAAGRGPGSLFAAAGRPGPAPGPTLTSRTSCRHSSTARLLAQLCLEQSRTTSSRHTASSDSFHPLPDPPPRALRGAAAPGPPGCPAPGRAAPGPTTPAAGLGAAGRAASASSRSSAGPGQRLRTRPHGAILDPPPPASARPPRGTHGVCKSACPWRRGSGTRPFPGEGAWSVLAPPPARAVAPPRPLSPLEDEAPAQEPPRLCGPDGPRRPAGLQHLPSGPAAPRRSHSLSVDPGTSQQPRTPSGAPQPLNGSRNGSRIPSAASATPQPGRATLPNQRRCREARNRAWACSACGEGSSRSRISLSRCPIAEVRFCPKSHFPLALRLPRNWGGRRRNGETELCGWQC